MALRGLVLCGAFSLWAIGCGGGTVSGEKSHGSADAGCGAIDGAGAASCGTHEDAGDAGDGGDSDSVSCVGSPAECTTWTLPQPDEVGYLKQTCTSGGGTIVPECPSANLIGCCTDFTGESLSETCYYSSGGSTETQADCKAAGGTWATTR